MDETEESRSDISSCSENESDGNHNVEATDPIGTLRFTTRQLDDAAS